jgi:hypothetical protein
MAANIPQKLQERDVYIITIRRILIPLIATVQVHASDIHRFSFSPMHDVSIVAEDCFEG